MTEKKRVIALGFFDGIHIGHSALMRRTLEIGRDKSLTPSVMTFDMHPLSLVSGKAIPLINSPEDRTGLIHRMFGISDIILLHFDKATASMPWGKFVDHLIGEFGARHLVAGHDYTFGDKGLGNSGLLARKCAETGLGCDIVPEVKLDGVTCSSSYIRGLISNGEMEKANNFLGHPHVLTDVVRYGYRIGRTLPTPTICLYFPEDVIIPAFGVYAVKVYLPESRGTGTVLSEKAQYLSPCFAPGVTYVGARPTVGGSGKITAETHILDYHENLYGRQVRIEFLSRLRPEIKFDSKAELKAHVQKDCENAARYFDVR